MLARNTETLSLMRIIVSVQMRIMNGTSSCLGLSYFPFSLTFVESHSDFNFIRQGNECIAVGPEPVPAGTCNLNDPNQMYKGSSGWRKVPGNTCEGGVEKDKKVDRKCSNGRFCFRVPFSGIIES